MENELWKAVLPCTPIKTAEFDLVALAAWLASEADTVQGKFFNEFDIQLRRICELNGGSAAMQIHNARKFLSSDAKYTLVDLGTE